MLVEVGMMTRRDRQVPFLNLIAGFRVDWSHFPKGFKTEILDSFEKSDLQHPALLLLGALLASTS